MSRLIISLAVASVFTTIPALALAAPRLIDSRDYMLEAVSVGVVTIEELQALELSPLQAFGHTNY